MPGLKEYAVKRFLSSLLTFFGVLTLVFFLSRVVPADPAALYAGPHPRPEQVERLRVMLGLDKPVWEQFIIYLSQFFSGDWGVSYRTHRPVLLDVLNALKASLELICLAFAIGVAVGLVLGIISALKADTWIDHLVRVVSVAGASLPSFFFAIVLQLIFAYWLGVLPTASRLSPQYAYTFTPITGFYLLDSLLQLRFDVFIDALAHMILPAIVLASYPVAVTARITRAMMVEVLQEQYVLAARAWGLPEKIVLFRYVLRNSIAPSITILAMSFAYTLMNAFLTEIIFAWPGIGTYAAMAAMSMDYPAILGTVVVGTIVFLAANTAADILHAFLDPRVRLR